MTMVPRFMIVMTMVLVAMSISTLTMSAVIMIIVIMPVVIMPGITMMMIIHRGLLIFHPLIKILEKSRILQSLSKALLPNFMLHHLLISLIPLIININHLVNHHNAICLPNTDNNFLLNTVKKQSLALFPSIHKLSSVYTAVRAQKLSGPFLLSITVIPSVNNSIPEKVYPFSMRLIVLPIPFINDLLFITFFFRFFDLPVQYPESV